jgi:WD40 repeat protein
VYRVLYVWGCALVWDAYAAPSASGASAAPIAVYRGHIRNLFCTAFSTDNRRVMSCGIDETIRVFDVERGFGSAHASSAGAGAGAGAGSALVIGDAQSELQHAAQASVVYTEHTRSVHRLSVIPTHSELLLSASADHTVRLWDLRTPGSVAVMRFQRPMHAVAACPFGGVLFATGGDRLFVGDLRRLITNANADRSAAPSGSGAGHRSIATDISGAPLSSSDDEQQSNPFAASRAPPPLMPALAQYYTGAREVTCVDWSADGSKLVCTLMKSYPLLFEVNGGSAGSALPGLTARDSVAQHFEKEQQRKESESKTRAADAMPEAVQRAKSWKELSSVPLVYAKYQLTGDEYRNGQSFALLSFYLKVD